MRFEQFRKMAMEAVPGLDDEEVADPLVSHEMTN